MAFTAQQKVDIRRFCGFAVFGLANASNFAYRYMKQDLHFEKVLISMSPEEESTLIGKYLNPCLDLEAAILTSSENLDTDRAAVWYHNKNEVADRNNLFILWCRRLMDYLKSFGDAKTLSTFRMIV